MKVINIDIPNKEIKNYELVINLINNDSSSEEHPEVLQQIKTMDESSSEEEPIIEKPKPKHKLNIQEKKKKEKEKKINKSDVERRKRLKKKITDKLHSGTCTDSQVDNLEELLKNFDKLSVHEININLADIILLKREFKTSDEIEKLRKEAEIKEESKTNTSNEQLMNDIRNYNWFTHHNKMAAVRIYRLLKKNEISVKDALNEFNSLKQDDKY
jgi:hypothetical protein